MSWDADDRPRSVTRAGIGTTTFAYDGDGARVKKVGPARTIRYLGSFEDHVTDTATVKHIFAGPLRVATRVVGPGPNAGTYFVHGDHLESLTVLTNGASDEVQRLSYQPFGSTQSNTGSVDFDFYRFTGQELDPETGLYDYGARYYHADLGRFVSADSVIPDLFDPQSLNRYSYALNNPVRLVDPTGSASSDPCPGGLCIKGSADGGSSSSPISSEGGSPQDFVDAIDEFFDAVGDFFDSLFGGDDDDEPPPPPLPPNVAGGFGGQILLGDQFTGSGAVADAGSLTLEAGAPTPGSPSLQRIPDPAVFGLLTSPQNGPILRNEVPLGFFARGIGTLLERGLGRARVGAGGIRPPGSPPPNLAPPGAGRRGAFGAAKRHLGIPRTQQPDSVGPNVDKRGNVQPGRAYKFRVPGEPPASPNRLTIRDDAAGSFHGPGDPQNRGQHFNTPDKQHFDYKR